MGSFWHQQWGENTIQAYTVVGAVILLVWLFRRYLSAVLAGWLFRWLGSVLSKVERSQFNALVITPLQRFVVVVVLIVALYRLQFPSALNVEIYRFEARDIVHAIGKLLIIATLTSLLLRGIDFAAILLEKRASRTPDLSDNQLIVFFKDRIYRLSFTCCITCWIFRTPDSSITGFIIICTCCPGSSTIS